ncbi:MAG: hypothetical protein FWE09_03220 [Treponema sp.]|nr:hypothetical protein [Treponema sp.]
MPAEKEKTVARGGVAFDSLLDETCERLLDMQIRHSIRRMRELELRLAGLEDELNDFIGKSVLMPDAPGKERRLRPWKQKGRP